MSPNLWSVLGATVALFALANPQVSGAYVGSTDKAVYALEDKVALPGSSSLGVGMKRSFSFGPKAHGGAGSWYYMRLRLRLKVGSLGEGPVALTASVNGLTSNRIEVAERRGRRCSSLLEWSSVDLIRGSAKGSSCNQTLMLSSVNFLQRNSVRPGVSILNVQVGGPIGAEGMLTVLPGSGVFRTSMGPAKLRFAQIEEGLEFPPGQWSELPFELVNDGGRPARRVSVDVVVDDGLEVRKRRLSIRSPIRAGERASASFWIRPKREGRFKLILGANSTANHPGVEVFLDAVEQGEDEMDGLRNMALGVSLLGILLLLLFPWRSRSRE